MGRLLQRVDPEPALGGRAGLGEGAPLELQRGQATEDGLDLPLPEGALLLRPVLELWRVVERDVREERPR